MDQKRTRGRPPKGAGTQTERINLRAEPDDKSRFERAARKAGVSLTEWVRDRISRAAKRELGD
jgi:uncharacterized protein (DUF1778 family)